MIEQILIGSCEHQRYRRAAQLAMLEYFMYPIDIVDVFWGWHADYHDASMYQDSLRKMGVDYFNDKTPRYRYTQSNVETKMRMLTHIVETDKNTIMIEDDFFLVMSRQELAQKLQNLIKVVDTSVEVVQLYNRTRVIDKPVKPVFDAEDFEQGCYAQGHTLIFVTPFGAEKLLAFMRDSSTPLSLENGMAESLHNEDWIYAVVPDQKHKYGKMLKCIQGDSIGTRLTQTGESIRRTDEQIKRRKGIIEYFKL